MGFGPKGGGPGKEEVRIRNNIAGFKCVDFLGTADKQLREKKKLNRG